MSVCGTSRRFAAMLVMTAVGAKADFLRTSQLRGRLLDLLNQHARLPQQGPQLPAFFEGLACVPPMLQRVFVAAWSARARRAAVHPTTSFLRSPPETCRICPSAF